MNWVERLLVFGLGGILLAAPLQADVTGPAANSYQVIIDRNPFGLKPPQPPPTNPPAAIPVTPINVKFTGITSDSTSKKAWLMIPPQPGKNANPKYLSLAEGDVDGDLKILEINEKENTVKILNAGTPVELNFKDYGLPTPASLLVPGSPNPHGVPGALPTPYAPVPGLPMPAIKTAGASPTGTAAADAMAARYGLQPGTAANTPIRTIPARNVRTTPVEPQVQATGTHVDPAVQRILMEAQQVRAQQEGVVLPPLPPR